MSLLTRICFDLAMRFSVQYAVGTCPDRSPHVYVFIALKTLQLKGVSFTESRIFFSLHKLDGAELKIC